MTLCSTVRFTLWRVLALLLLTAPLTMSGTGAEGQAARSQHAPSRFTEPAPMAFDDYTGFEQVFDGKSLADWEGDPSVWRVQDGAIVGESTKDHPVTNTYIWRKRMVLKDFDLRLEIKCEIGGGSGIQYRSQTGLPWLRALHPGEKPRNLDWMMTGPQADMWFPVNPLAADYTGQFYSENTPLGILAWRGEIVEMGPKMPKTLVGILGDREALGGYVKLNDWNQYEIIARGGVMTHIVNGHVMAILIDDDPASSNNQAGKIGIELESTPAKVSVREVWIKRLP